MRFVPQTLPAAFRERLELDAKVAALRRAARGELAAEKDLVAALEVRHHIGQLCNQWVRCLKARRAMIKAGSGGCLSPVESFTTPICLENVLAQPRWSPCMAVMRFRLHHGQLHTEHAHAPHMNACHAQFPYMGIGLSDNFKAGRLCDTVQETTYDDDVDFPQTEVVLRNVPAAGEHPGLQVNLAMLWQVKQWADGTR